ADDLMRWVAATIQQALGCPKELRAELERQAKLEDTDRRAAVAELEKKRARLEKEQALAERNLARGKQEREFQAGSRVLAELDGQRQSLDECLAQARAALARQTTQHQLVEDALAQWSNLAEVMADPAVAEEAGDVVAALVEEVQLTFTQQQLPSG